MKRLIIKARGVRWIPAGGPDSKFTRIYPPPENPTAKELEAAQDMREFINAVCVPELLAAGIRV